MTLAQFLLRAVRPVELAELLKRLLGISYSEQRIGTRTYWLDPASNFGDRLLSGETYEPEFSAHLVGLLKPGDVFIDLGANEGYFSLLASDAVGASGRVYAIEPQARLWPVILHNFALNQKLNCTLLPYAVGEQEGFIEMLLFPSLNTGATTAVHSRRRFLHTRQKAAVMPLAKMIEARRITRVAALKIDIEGYELFALKSLGRHLAEGLIENLIVEMHPAQLAELGQSVHDVEQLLENSGYVRSGKHGPGGNEFWHRRK
ncbi:MAG: FkbM family methyltransferase [Proteobacteria bacterium]|nr:FkbM family methyltransferase [Pseudomonadota bacterium]